MDSNCSSECVKEASVPSFSSTLLDAIYHSIEESDQKMLLLYNETMKKKNSSNYERACRVEKWMEKNQIGKNEVIAKKSVLDFESKTLRKNNALFIKSSSSGSGSSDSSSGGGFSSSETESIGHGVSSKTMGGSCYGLPKPKPVKKTEKLNKYGSKNIINVGQERIDLCDQHEKPKSETNFIRSKSSSLRALRFIGDLKKVNKQPISPGGRVSSFLSYLFAVRNTKKTSSNNEIGSEKCPKSANSVSTCSTASSFSRSCMSNSSGKPNNGNKRTVRFYPVSVIVDEDCQPCGEKKLYDRDDVDKGLSHFRPNVINKDCRRVDKAEKEFDRREFRPNVINEELKSFAMNKDCRVDKVTRAEREFDKREFRIRGQEFGQANDEDEDDESCASSDLFELDNLSAFGNGNMDMYHQELPVYETTSVHSNTHMANGLKLVKIEAM